MKATTKTRAKAKSLTRVGDPECHVARRTSHGEKLVGHGAAAIQTVRETRPDVYVKVVASLLPRQVQAKVSGPAHPLATAIDGGDIVHPVFGLKRIQSVGLANKSERKAVVRSSASIRP